MRTLTILLVLAALAMPVDASHCTTYTTSRPEIDTGTLYVDNDPCGCLFSIWVYHESNGIPGLQRGDEVVDDTCHGSIPSDTIIF